MLAVFGHRGAARLCRSLRLSHHPSRIVGYYARSSSVRIPIAGHFMPQSRPSVSRLVIRLLAALHLQTPAFFACRQYPPDLVSPRLSHARFRRFGCLGRHRPVFPRQDALPARLQFGEFTNRAGRARNGAPGGGLRLSHESRSSSHAAERVPGMTRSTKGAQSRHGHHVQQ